MEFYFYNPKISKENNARLVNVATVETKVDRHTGIFYYAYLVFITLGLGSIEPTTPVVKIQSFSYRTLYYVNIFRKNS